MKFEISTKEMQGIIKRANKLLPKNSTVPLIENLHVRAKNNVVMFTATDLENVLELNIEANVIEDGVTLLDQGALKLINKLKTNFLIIEQERITSNNKVIEFYVEEEQLKEYPCGWPKCNILAFKTTEKVLTSLLVVKFASSHDESRAAFNSVVIDKEYFYASDTYRIARRKIPFENSLPEKFLLSLKAATLFDGYLSKKSDKEVSCFVSKREENKTRYMTFIVDNMKFITREVNEKYPDITGVWPSSYESTLTVPYNHIVEELDFIGSATEGINSAIGFEQEGNNVVMLTKSLSKNVKSNINSNVSGEFFRFYINQRFLLETIKHMDNKEVIFNLSNKNGPIVIGGDLILPIKMD